MAKELNEKSILLILRVGEKLGGITPDGLSAERGEGPNAG